MTAVRFDTLDYAQKLETAGVPPEQAAVQAKALGEALTGTDAFRDDLAKLESSLDRKFAKVDARFETIDARLVNMESRFNTKIDTLGNELTLLFGGKLETLKWMFGVLVALNGAMFVQLFFKH
ncbi:MAG: hypothetical protein M3R40_05875 [Pseudomonadota bacterium]|nr:hypothetical protein [Pseudomonadota bacterium]